MGRGAMDVTADVSGLGIAVVACVTSLVILGRRIRSVLMTVAFIRLPGAGCGDADNSAGMHR